MPYIGNKYEIGDHNNSWKTLDDISSYVATFDGSATNAVSTTNNTIRVPEHRFIQGQRVTYSNGGGGNIGGLTTGSVYYIIHDTNNEFKLATSLDNANASTAINLSAVGSGTSHTVTAAFDGVNKKFKITYSGGKSSRFTSATQLSIAINNILQRPNDTATFTDGFRISDNEKIEFNVAPVADDIFWGSILSASLPTFDISDNKLDNFTGDGSTTDFTLSHIPANNESIIVTVNGVVQHPTDKNGTRAYSLDASVLVFTAAPANGDEIQVRHIGFAGASSSAVTGFYGRTGNVTLSSSADNAIVGVITATKFSGAFDGTITSGNDIIAGIITANAADIDDWIDVGNNIQLGNAGVITATTFRGDGDFVELDVDGHTNLDNVSIAGVVTATTFVGNGDFVELDVDGHTNLDNVSIAGVTTFTGAATLNGNTTFGADVTFGGGGSATALVWDKSEDDLIFADNSKAIFGTNSDGLEIYHASNHSYIADTGSGYLRIQAADYLQLGTASAPAAFLNCESTTGSVYIAHNGNDRIQTTNTGVSITGNNVVSGNVTAVDGTFSGNVSIGGTLTYEDVTNVDAVGLITARNGIKVTGGNTVIGDFTPVDTRNTGGIHIQDNKGISFKAHSSGNSRNWRIRNDDFGWGNLDFSVGTSNSDFADAASEMVLSLTSSRRVGINEVAPDAPLHITGSLPHIRLENSGTSASAGDVLGKLDFYHNDSDDAGVTAIIQCVAEDAAGNSYLAFHNGDGGNADERFRIDSSGNLHVGGATASATAGSLYINDTSAFSSRIWQDAGNSALVFGTGSGQVERLRITSTGLVTNKGTWTNTYAANNTTQCGYQTQNLSDTTNTYAALRLTAGASSPATAQLSSIRTGAGQNDFTIQLETSNTAFEALRINSSGHILPGTAGTQNLGSASKEFNNLYLGDSGKAYFGLDQDFSIYHNNSHGLIKNTTGRLYLLSDDLWIKNEADNKTAARFFEGNEVFLYHNDTVRLTTTSTGITVGGEVAASQDYPNFRPTLDLNFAAVKKLDPRITYSRIGGASYVDEYGIVKLVSENIPRFDHYPDTGECLGLLIEEARTSRLTQSTGNDSYGHYKQTDRGETIKGPDGVENSAREYTANSDASTGGSTSLWANEALGMASGISVSYFVKITRGSTIAFQIMDNNNGQESEKVVLSGGYITDGSYATVSQNDPGSTEGTTSYERYPNGWVKVKWEGASNNANTTSYIQLYIYDHASSNGTNIGYAIWGFQVESGAFCTSTIPKPTTAAVTRGSDDLVIDGGDFTDFINKSEGTILADYKVIGGGPEIMYLSNNNSNCRIGLYEAGSSQTRFLVNNAGTLADTTDSAGTTVGDNIKSAGAYKLNDVAASKNGVISSTDSSVTIPTGVDRAYIGGYYNGDVEGSLGLRRLVYYQQRLPNSQLVTLTA